MIDEMEDFEGVDELSANSLETLEDTEGLSDSERDYLQELNVDSKSWESMSDMEKQNAVSEITERLDELGISNPEEQDRALRDAEVSPELLGEYREEIFSDKISELDECSPENEITEEQFMNECPEGAQTLSMMHERLDNNYEEGIMNNLKFYKLDNGDYAIIHDADGEPNTKAVFSEGCVYANPGAIEGGNNGLNEVINTKHAVPNTTYFVDGRTCYEHDSQGRLIKETTVYTKDFVEKSERGTPNQTFIRDSKDGMEGDDSSHSVQYGLGGPNEAINQTPMRGDINKGGDWRGEEQKIVDAVNEGKTVYSEHTYSYEGESARPSTVTSQIRIENEVSDVKEFDNRLSDNTTESEKRFSLETSENAFSEVPRGSLSEVERQYIDEAINDGSETMIVNRIDELNGDIIPPKAIDSNPEMKELLGESTDYIDKKFLEAPSDHIQVEETADALSHIEGTEYSQWEKLSFEQRVEALQNIETQVADIAHRPDCIVKVQNLSEGNYGYFDPATKEIVVNEKFISENNPNSHHECLDTILHEGRHAYQDYNLNCRQVHSSPGDINNWRMNEEEYSYQDAETYGFKSYYMQPVECDARKFAEDVLSKYENTI